MGKASRRRTASREFQGSTRAAKDPAASRRRSWPARSRGCRVRPTGSRCARSSPPRPPPSGSRPAPWPPTPRRPATVATVLPLAWSGLRRIDGEVMVGLQSGTTTGDASRDLAQVLLATAAAEPGTPGPLDPAGDRGHPAAAGPARPRRAVRGERARGLRLLGRRQPGARRRGQGVPRAGQRLGHPDDQAGARPTRRTGAASASAPTCAGCCRTTRTRPPTPSPGCTPAAASAIGDDTRLLGAFRACGLLVPVWELDPDARRRGVRGGGRRAGPRFAEALAVEGPLTPRSGGPGRAC